MRGGTHFADHRYVRPLYVWRSRNGRGQLVMALKRFVLYALAGALVLTAASAAFDSAPTEAQHSAARYCDMVDRWRAEAANGVPPERRSGWPDYRGMYDQYCQ